MNETQKFTNPQWMVVRLADDLNWWVESTSESEHGCAFTRGVLDPRQVAHLAEVLHEYRAHGFRWEQLTAAFCLFGGGAVIEDGRLRVNASEAEVFGEGTDQFALPVIYGVGVGPYYDFLDALAAAHIRQLNATHHYARECTEEEMYAELDAREADLYFSDENIHCFDEINELLEWSPAAWDDSVES